VISKAVQQPSGEEGETIAPSTSVQETSMVHSDIEGCLGAC
jgi:hypothetical protein